ncbi:MAG: hypothetical protein NUV51_11095 [Sulfuricaulis sp.]|nr:hypothetical protein [Sulfuricaulis sp.]
MGGVIQVEPGGEIYIPYAKKKLRELHEYMTRAGLGAFNKRIDVSDGSAIYLNSLALGNGQFTDKIRITSGVDYKYIILLSVLASEPLLEPPFSLVEPVSYGVSLSYGSAVAYLAAGGPPHALYSEVVVNYSYADEYGVLHASSIGGATSGGIGLEVTYAVFDYITATLVGTYGGLPLYAPPATGPSFPLEYTIPSGYSEAVVRHNAALRQHYSDWYTASTANLISQLSGVTLATADLHGRIYNAFPEHPDTLLRIPNLTRIDFYYISTESAAHVWGAFGVPPYNDADGDEKLYLIPIATVKYDEAGATFIAANPATMAVLRDPVEEGRLATWNWAELPATTHLQQPADNTPPWPNNVVAVFHPKADGGVSEGGSPRQDAWYIPQETSILSALSTYPLTSSAVCTMRNFCAAATPQPSGYTVPAPPPP